MKRSLCLVVSLAALGACTESLDVIDYSPSLSQVRYGRVATETLDEPVVLPEALFIPGVTVFVEDQEGYDNVPLLLTPQQMENLADFDDDPAPLNNHSSYAYEFARGDLYDATDGTIDFDDVQQGAIGDCYFVAALSAVLYADVDGRVRDGFIRPVRDAAGDPVHYAVRFYDYAGRPQDIEIDAELVRSSSGNPTYARSMDSKRGDEEWGISLLEKAYAKWHGDYEAIGDGGSPGDVMQALTGSHSSYRRIASLSDSTVISIIADSVESHRPLAALTFGEDDGVDYAGTSIYAWHAYTVLGVREIDGETKVKLRNPWGSTEPPGDGVNDGIFEIPLATFRRLYMGFSIGGGLTVDTTAPSAVNDLAVPREGDGLVVVNFTATGDDGRRGLAYRYDLRVSSTPITADNFYSATAVGIADPQSPGSRETVQIDGLTNGEVVYVAVRVEDESGNLSPISNVISATPVSELPVVDLNALVFDFETAHNNVLADGLFHASTTHTVNGGTAMWCGSEASGDYNVGRAEGALLIDTIDLAPYASPTISWDQRLTTEQTSTYDHAFVEVFDAGGNWIRVWERDEVTSGVEESIVVDLSAFANQTISVMFQFDSVEASANEYEGWIIDNVVFQNAR